MRECPLCGNKKVDVLSNVLRRGTGTVYYCSQCDYGFLDSDFDDAKKYYNEEYRKKFKDVLNSGEESPSEIYEMRKNYQGDRLNIISPYFDNNKRFLEIGSSAGQFLSQIVTHFKEVVGIELSNSCAEYAEKHFGVKVFRDALEQIAWSADDRFDYIGFFQVLEHIKDPVQFMKNVNERLVSGGKVFIEVPNLYDPLRTVWNVPAYESFFYHEAHISYFTEKSIVKLLRMTGFDVEDVIYLQDYNFLNHLYWYFNNGPQNECTFGLNKPYIDFLDEKCGQEINKLLLKTNEAYFDILQRNKLTSNMMVIGRACN